MDQYRGTFIQQTAFVEQGENTEVLLRFLEQLLLLINIIGGKTSIKLFSFKYAFTDAIKIKLFLWTNIGVKYRCSTAFHRINLAMRENIMYNVMFI